MDSLQAVLERLRRVWASFSFNQKAILVIVLGAALVSSLVFVRWLRQDDMVVLSSDLSAEDAAEILDQVSKAGVRAELGNAGHTILVPASEVDRLRVGIASQGLPRQGRIGWEIFNKGNYGMTEFQENVTLRRALEGELARTIESIQGVKSARVHITLPQQSLFLRDERAATAAVLLTLRGRGRPGREQIEGIQHLVANAVEGLQPGKVTVVDNSGAVMSSDDSDDAAGLSSKQLRVRKEVEDYLGGKAADMLAAVLGPGHSMVRVNAELDFDRIERTTEQYDPQTVVRSEERTDESNPGAGGTTERSLTNYEVSRTVQKVLNTGGGVHKLDVAVFVDGKHAPAADAKGGQPASYTPRTSEELDQIQRIVAKSVGVDPTRGDLIEVVNMQFDVPQAPKTTLLENPMLQTAPSLIGRLALFAVAAVLILGLRRSLGKMVREVSRPLPDVGPVRGAALARAKAEARTPVADMEDWARGDPEEVANLIKAFASSEE
jgi:flagellar M-ring protein FliF